MKLQNSGNKRENVKVSREKNYLTPEIRIRPDFLGAKLETRKKKKKNKCLENPGIILYPAELSFK